MKTNIILLLTITAFAPITQANSNSEEIDAIKKLTTFSLPLTEKFGGFRYAERNDTKEINQALVISLNDPSKGGRILSDMAVSDPWIDAMIILIKRFPEAGIKESRTSIYTEAEKHLFKKWWTENQAYIIYNNDNTHIIAPHASLQSASSEAEQHPDEDSKPATSTPRVNANPTSGAESPFPEKTPDTVRWSLVGALVLSALGLLWMLLGRKK